MLPTGDVGREFIPVLAVVATQVAFKGISETMTAHVDGVHDMVQEEYPTVFALVNLHLLPAHAYHPQGILRAFSGCPQHLVGLVFLLDGQAIAGMRVDVVGQVDEATSLLLIVTLGVRGVLAAVAGGGFSFRRHRLGFGQKQQIFHSAVLGGVIATWRTLWVGLVELIYWIDNRDHLGASWGCLYQRTQGLCSQVVYGIVDGLVHHMGLHELILLLIAGTAIVGHV